MSLPLPRLGPRKFLHDRQREIEARTYRRIRLRPLAPVIGATVEGVDLASALDDETFSEIQAAHLDYKVLFFRDQAVDTASHLAFARRFGELEEHPFLSPKEGHDDVVEFEKSADVVGVENIWHSDVSWRKIPSLGSVLRAREVPEVGGDTAFSDMEAAYDGLDDALKERLDGMQAVHDFALSFGQAMSPEQLAESRERFPPATHPVIRTHPETGRKSIYVNGIFTSHIVDVEREESDRLLDHLYRQALYPEYQCRFRWEADSIVFWDNRAVQHYASNDYWPARRVMERVTIIGDRPR